MQKIFILLFITNALLGQEINEAHKKAYSCYENHKIDSTLFFLNKASELYLAEKDSVHFLNAYTDLFWVLKNENNIEKILKYEKLINQFCPKINDLQTVLCYSYLGEAYFFSFQYDKAEFYYSKAINTLETTNQKDLVIEGIAYNNFGLAKEKQGDFRSAINYYQKAKLLYEQAKETENISISLSNIAQSFLSLGEFKNAEHFFIKSLQYAKSSKHKIRIFGDLASLNLSDKLNNNTKALNYANKALNISIKEKATENTAKILRHIGFIHFSRKNYVVAQKFYKESLSIAEKKKQFDLCTIVAKNLGELYAEIKLTDTSKFWYNRAMKYATGKMNIQLKNIKYPAYALYTLQSFQKNIGLIPLNYITLADSLIDLMRQEHTEQNSKLFWREKTHSFYENAIETCMQLNDIPKAFYFMEKSRAILLLDALKDTDAKKILSPDQQNTEQNLRYRTIGLQNRLNNILENDKNHELVFKQLFDAKEKYGSFIASLEKTNPEFYNLKYNNKHLTISDLQNKLKESNQTFIEYFVGEKNVFAILVSGSEAVIKKIDLDKYKTLSLQIVELSAQSPPHTKEQLAKFQVVSNQFYALAFQIFKVKTARVIVSQDNYLLPFEALVVDLKSKEFLVKNFAFSYAYSANVLFKKREKNWHFSQNLLGFSPVHFNKSLAVNNLEGSDDVMKNIENTYFSGKTFMNEAATKANFVKNAPNANIIQLFTHGKADSTEAGSAIYFQDSVLSISELYQFPKLHADLIVLSACQTNLGRNATGEGIMSFARGFAFLGVPSTISTLWRVNNQSTYDITAFFYKNLKAGFEKDVALQMAQNEYLEKTNNQMPYFWSGLILIGNSESIQQDFSFLPIILVAVILLGGLITWMKYRKKDI